MRILLFGSKFNQKNVIEIYLSYDLVCLEGKWTISNFFSNFPFLFSLKPQDIQGFNLPSV